MCLGNISLHLGICVGEPASRYRGLKFLSKMRNQGDDGLPSSTRYQIIGIALFNGAGTAAILVSSLSLTAQLIGKNTSTAAFVYGAMSLTDKIANGVAVIIGELSRTTSNRHNIQFKIWTRVRVTVKTAGISFDP